MDGTVAAPVPVTSARLGRAARREALLDVAAGLVGSGQLDAVTMESVAEASGVSRALVYRHFANRAELLGALYAGRRRTCTTG